MRVSKKVSAPFSSLIAKTKSRNYIKNQNQNSHVNAKDRWIDRPREADWETESERERKRARG